MFNSFRDSVISFDQSTIVLHHLLNKSINEVNVFSLQQYMIWIFNLV